MHVSDPKPFLTCKRLTVAAGVIVAVEIALLGSVTAGDKHPTWHTQLANALADAQRLQRPVLVLFSSPSSPPSRKLDEELRSAKLRSELSRWTVANLDVDQMAKEARALAVSGVPALRVLTPAGRAVAARDGTVSADVLAAWLKEHHALAIAPPSGDLLAEDSPDAIAVLRLVGELRERDAVLREAAIRRLLAYPEFAAVPVTEAFAKGPLQTRLAALELLHEWQAPVAELDPWRPETLTDTRLTALKAWAAKPGEFNQRSSEPLGSAALTAARQEIERMLKGDDAEAAVVRERLSRHGPLLLPEVYAQLKETTTDTARERLTALRYRLVASAALALTWPGGLERLAKTAAVPRQQAIEELVARAGAGDEALLLELFSSTDPLVRELSLRTLKETVGPRATEAMTRLLSDPEPNVRAAVLKQLAEQPTPTMVAKVVDYVDHETDPDLVVHAIRAIRDVHNPRVFACVKALLDHESWRVRAEAAEALGKRVGRYGGNNSEEHVEVFVALIKLLDDPDGFVVGRAITPLRYGNLAVAIEPLVRAAENHADLAADVATTLAGYSAHGPKVLPHLQKMCVHARPEVRAAAITSLCSLTLRPPQQAMERFGPPGVNRPVPIDYTPDKEIKTALTDSTSVVRRAAIAAVFSYLQMQRPNRYQYAGPNVVGNEEDPLAWLEKFRIGKERPAWLAKVPPLLDARIMAGEPEERLEAALLLTVLADDERTAKVLVDLGRSEPELGAKAALALPWLPWPKRLELFKGLLEANRAPEALAAVATQMAELPDRQVVPHLWQVLADGKVPADAAGAWLAALELLYFGPGMHQIHNGEMQVPVARRKEAADAADTYLQKGPDLQRLVALALLVPADGDRAAEAARKIMADVAVSAALRRNAYHILLCLSNVAGTVPVALEGLANADPEMRALAVKALALGTDSYDWATIGKLHLTGLNQQQHQSRQAFGNGQVIVPEAPKGLTADAIRPLLKDADPAIAAQAAYLLALLNNPAGLAPLVSYWKGFQRKDHSWTRLVYRAVAALGDDANVPILEEIYRGFQNEPYLLREFYWTIRILDGPNALRLRKQMRKEVGMQNL